MKKNRNNNMMFFGRAMAALLERHFLPCPWEEGNVSLSHNGLRFVVTCPNYNRDETYTGLQAVSVIRDLGRTLVEGA